MDDPKDLSFVTRKAIGMLDMPSIWIPTVYQNNFFVSFSLPIEYYDSIKSQIPDSYSVISQVWMLFL